MKVVVSGLLAVMATVGGEEGEPAGMMDILPSECVCVRECVCVWCVCGSYQ